MTLKGARFILRLTPSNGVVRGVVWMLGLISLGFSIYATSVGFSNSLYDFHGFRQAQTAIAADSILHGGSFFHYEMPVFGRPWSLPFEFPLYQGIVASAARLFSAPLDQTGRVVSILLYYLSFFPLASILSRIGLKGTALIPTLSLFAVSPLYVFISRLFMIESTALFLSLMYTDQMFRLVRSARPWLYRYVAGAAVFGVLAGLVKVTTFAPYFVLGTALVAWEIWKDRETWKTRSGIATAVAILCVGLPLEAIQCWTAFADDVKQRNPFGVYLTSKALTAWTFGPFDQRLHPRTYLGLIYNADNQVGSVKVVLVILLVYAGLIRKWNWVAVWCAGLYVGTILLFFNLHVVHEYYPYSICILLLVAIGVLITEILKSSGSRPWIGLALLVLEMGSCGFRYFTHYYPIQVRNAAGRPAAAELLDRTTRTDGAIVIVGLDWSPEFPYQSHRRAIMNIALDTRPESWSMRPIEDAIAIEGAGNVTAVVACAGGRYGKPIATLLQDVGMTSPTELRADDCDIYERGLVGENVPHHQSDAGSR